MDKIADRNQKILAIVIVIAVLILGIYKIFFEKNVFEEEKIDTETISVVEDNSRFFTVSSCVSKYIRYLSDRNTENLLILLSNEYKNNNSINSENLYNFVGVMNSNETFYPKKMFQQRLTKTIYKYYVYGFVEEDIMGATSPRRPYYVIVILDEDNMSFAIEPYDGSLFKQEKVL